MKIGMRTQAPVVAVKAVAKPTYEELEVEVKRLRDKLDQTVRISTRQTGELKKQMKYMGDQIEWLRRKNSQK